MDSEHRLHDILQHDGAEKMVDLLHIRIVNICGLTKYYVKTLHFNLITDLIGCEIFICDRSSLNKLNDAEQSEREHLYESKNN